MVKVSTVGSFQSNCNSYPLYTLNNSLRRFSIRRHTIQYYNNICYLTLSLKQCISNFLISSLNLGYQLLYLCLTVPEKTYGKCRLA